MLGTRLAFVLIALIAFALNGLALFQFLGIVQVLPGLVPAALIVSMIVIPVGVWSAYNIGEMAEGEYRRTARETAAVAGAAAATQQSRAETEGEETPGTEASSETAPAADADTASEEQGTTPPERSADKSGSA